MSLEDWAVICAMGLIFFVVIGASSKERSKRIRMYAERAARRAAA